MAKRTKRETDDITVTDITKRGDYRSVIPESSFEFIISFTIVQGSEIDFGRHFRFSGNKILIGRSKDNQIRLNDSKVSKIHCEIDIIRKTKLEQVLIKDLNSTNGTFLNEELISQGFIKSGDKIRIGSTVLRVNYHDEIEEEYHSKLFDFAAFDALTGLYNRRYILNELENHCKIAKRNNRIFSLIIVDIDNFKKVNDQYGHLAGDECLKKIAYIMNNSLREQDICGRYGGEEFLIILPETKLEGAVNLAERIRKKIEGTNISFQKHQIKNTISAGVSQFNASIPDNEYLFKMADKALRKAKELGKNKIEKVFSLLD
jgi:diguanylate cyclase (GGDEF)-like protein